MRYLYKILNRLPFQKAIEQSEILLEGQHLYLHIPFQVSLRKYNVQKGRIYYHILEYITTIIHLIFINYFKDNTQDKTIIKRYFQILS